MKRILAAISCVALAFSSIACSTQPETASAVKDDSSVDANFVSRMNTQQGMIVRVPAGEDVSTSANREVRVQAVDQAAIGSGEAASAAFDAGFNSNGFGELVKTGDSQDSSTGWYYTYYTYTWYYTYTYTWTYWYAGYYYYYYPIYWY